MLSWIMNPRASFKNHMELYNRSTLGIYAVRRDERVFSSSLWSKGMISSFYPSLISHNSRVHRIVVFPVSNISSWKSSSISSWPASHPPKAMHELDLVLLHEATSKDKKSRSHPPSRSLSCSLFVCCFKLIGDLLSPRSQINTQIILTYECLTLTWLFSSQVF